VKGPNDRLSDKQLSWFDLLLSAGLDVELCHVTDALASSTSVSVTAAANDASSDSLA
jgi:hypothetical protein